MTDQSLFDPLLDARPLDRPPLGKIGRLPGDIRNELNRRIRQNEFGTRLVVWLNSLPRVQAILASHFHGRPINAVNLTKWKAGPYRDWRFNQKMDEALKLIASFQDGKLTHHHDSQINPGNQINLNLRLD
jgi:hypothetical protein